MILDRPNPKLGDEIFTNTNKVFVYEPTWKVIYTLNNENEYNQCVKNGLLVIHNLATIDILQFPLGTLILHCKQLYILSGYWRETKITQQL